MQKLLDPSLDRVKKASVPQSTVLYNCKMLQLANLQLHWNKLYFNRILHGGGFFPLFFGEHQPPQQILVKNNRYTNFGASMTFGLEFRLGGIFASIGVAKRAYPHLNANAAND